MAEELGTLTGYIGKVNTRRIGTFGTAEEASRRAIDAARREIDANQVPWPISVSVLATDGTQERRVRRLTVRADGSLMEQRFGRGGKRVRS